jgi:cobalt/nickel transport system ATP-binding protein
MPDILEITDLNVRYPDGTEALSGVSLRLPAGWRMALIGPNGAGKTTLQLAVMGGVKSTGKIVVDGIELRARKADEIRGRCGMIFESPDDQLFMPTLLEDVAFGPLNQGYAPPDAEARSRSAIAAVGLEGLEQRPAHHFSAGQKRGAALATALSMNVKLLLLDEPAAGLDFRSRRRLIEILAGREEAMLLASHDLEMVGELCQQAALLDGGRLVASGPVQEILGASALLREHGLQ